MRLPPPTWYVIEGDRCEGGWTLDGGLVVLQTEDLSSQRRHHQLV